MLAKSEIAISWLRTELQALPIFPNVKYLTIEYEIPSALERITFFAILKGLPPLQSVKYLKLDIMIHYKLPNKRYQQVYPELSKNTKQFLGGEIHSDMVEAYTMEHLPNPTFPILRELSLWVSRVGIAELDSGEPHLTEKGFYHLILMAAPETESFYLKTIDLRSRSNTHPIFEQFDQEAVVTGSAPPDIICPKMNLLTIETDDHRLACAFENVAKMFPNLTEFEIMLSDGTLHTNQWGFELYRGLMGLKQLENIVLPWPRDVSGFGWSEYRDGYRDPGFGSDDDDYDDEEEDDD
ncbi:uncharacterized protein DFL_001187 [Arthrobotrys flagrans]|uniref:Uncharacterized protein n=1 Tax=Arthrobotrys flagrans TaxID=97331 RepID=A0A437AGE1_ARTFL|nr:hypothetical protein DFL_001187 [Arthrobotrys flagrans]